MKHVAIDLTRAAAIPEAYREGRYDLAIGGLTRIATALAAAGCRVTILADPVLAASPAAALRPPITVRPADGHAALLAGLAALAPDACLLWNGTHMPGIVTACRALGIPPIFAEAGWFDRLASVFVDPLGVTLTSTLAAFEPSPALPAATVHTRLAGLAALADRVPPVPGDYLLLLLDPGHRTYFDPRHQDPAVIIDQLRHRFPHRRLAVRAHPINRDHVRRLLPPGVIDANDGDLLDWAAFCTAAIGAASKAMFAPVLYGRPVIMVGASVATGIRPYPGFAQRGRITAITEDDLTDRSRCTLASAFVYEAAFHRHLFFDDCSLPALRQNRVLAPLLPS